MLGSTITIDSRPFTVVGILPQGFTGTTQIFAPEIWLPLGVYDQVANDFETENKDKLDDRAGRQLMLVGRLKPGMTAAAADPALKTLAANLEQAYPVEQKDQTFMIERAFAFLPEHEPDQWRQYQTTGAAAFRNVGRRAARRLPESGQHAARARRRRAERKSRSGSRWAAVAGGSCGSCSSKASSSR